MKKILVVYSEYTPTVDAIQNYLSEMEITISNDIVNEKLELYDLVIGVGNIDINMECKSDILLCHKSLLPAFDSTKPIYDAILSGVKVTGITIYWAKSKKILAQYPIFIQNEWHYDDLELELQYLEQSLFPLIIEKVVKNEIFDMKNILKKTNNSSCSDSTHCSNCSNCGGCNSCCSSKRIEK